MKPCRRLFLLFSITLVVGGARAVTTIYPVGAIEDLWKLPAEEFRQKYAGINATGLGPSDEGWYVRYRHENMTLLFGPLAEREDARRQKWDLETVRDAAIRNRPTLASSQVDYVKFSFTGVYGKGGSGNGGKAGSGEGADGDGSGKDGRGDADKGADGLGKDGTGSGGKLAGLGDGEGDGSGTGKGGKNGKSGKAGKSGTGDGSGDGEGDDPNGIVGAGKGGPQQVASLGGGGGGQQGGSSGGQGGQSGSQGSQGGQQGGGQQGGGQQGGGQQGGAAGGGGSPGGPPSGGSGGGGNPLQLVAAVLRAILGL